MSHEEHHLHEGAEHLAQEVVEGFDAAVTRTLPPHLRARQWARRRRSTHVMWQAGVLIVGFSVLIAGLVMLVLPGPGWAAIFLGLVILASEYAWAHRLLAPLKRLIGAITARVRRVVRRGSAKP